MLRSTLQRDQWIILVCLVTVCAIAWWWLLDMSSRASTAGMDAMDMGGMDMTKMAMPAEPPLFATFLMWFVMMVAMMVPSAAPMILIYERFAESTRKAGGALMPTALFALLYLAVWAVFSLAATIAQILLSRAGLIDATSLAIGGRHIAGGLLIAAALYQLSPIKRSCLENCRSPFSFLRREWGPGWRAAARLGIKHGIYCVGCCWLLMSLLFVGGVMNLAWVAILAVIILVEKVAPLPHVTRVAAAGGALFAGIYLLLF